MNVRKNIQLKPDEQIVKIVRQYGLVHIWKFLVFAVIILVDFFFMFWLFKQGWWGAIVFAVVLVIIILAGLKWLIVWRNNFFAITNYRIVDCDQQGFFDKHVGETALNKISDVTYRKKGVMQAVFGYGNIALEVANSDTVIVLDKVKNPQKVYRLIIDLIDQGHL